jgi:hypothetical protein
MLVMLSIIAQRSGICKASIALRADLPKSAGNLCAVRSADSGGAALTMFFEYVIIKVISLL